MATKPNETEPMVQLPAAKLEALLSRLDALEQTQRVQTEALLNPRSNILDKAYDAWKQEAGRPASARTQDIADKTFGTSAPRFTVRQDGKPGPRIDEWFPLQISAVDRVQAEGRYLELCGIKKHDYQLRTEPVAA